MTTTTKTLDDYLRLPYKVEVLRDDEAGYFARVPELPGCMTWADRIDALWSMVEDAKRAWIADALASGDEVPLPRDEATDAGVSVVHVPTALHRRLAQQAEQAGLSVDEFVATRLRQAVGE